MTRSNIGKRRLTPEETALAKTATAFILANMGEDGLFPTIRDGNMGVSAYVASETGGAAVLDLAKDLNRGVPIAQSFAFDPKKHSVIVVVASEDEPHLHLVVLDRASGNFTPITDINVVDLPSASADVFTRCFADVSQEDADWGDLMTALLGDGQYLDLGEGGADALWWT